MSVVDDLGRLQGHDLLPAREGVVAGPEAALVAKVELGGGARRAHLDAYAQALHRVAVLVAAPARRPLPDELGQGHDVAIDLHRQVATEAGARRGQIPDLRGVEPQAAA